MTTHIKYQFFVLAFLFQSILHGQSPAIDSLINVLKTTKQDTIKVNILNNLFLEYEFSDSEKAEECLKKSVDLGQKTDFMRGLAKAYLYMGYFAEDKSNFVEALKHYSSSLQIFEGLKDKKAVADAYMNIGSAYYNQGNYPEALKAHFKSLKIKEEIGDKKGVSYSYIHIGNVYNNQGNFAQALKNHLASLEINKELKDKRGISNSYNNIGISYYNMKKFSDALTNHFESLKLKKERDDRKGVANSYNNIGIVYFDQGDFEEALKNHFESLKIKEEIGDIKGVASSEVNIGQIYFKQKKYAIAKDFINKGKQRFIGMRAKEELKETYRDLTEIEVALTNYKEAYENHKLYILYRDSIDNEETRKNTIQTQMNYDFEKKEAVAKAEHKKELENQEVLSEEKNRKQKTILAFVVIGLFLVLIFAGFVFRSLRITRKQKHIIELQKNLVEEQKNKVEHQKHIVEEHQKEIIDSIMYARRIQRSLLPTEKYIDRNINRLKKL